jgi:5-methylcytosine-specific restriction endonuclease McrA
MPYKDPEKRRAQGRLSTRRYRAKRHTNPEPFRQRERERYRRHKDDPERNAKLLAANRRRKATRRAAARSCKPPRPPMPADPPPRPPSPTAAKKHAYYLANQDRIKARARARYAANPVLAVQKSTAWKQTHPRRRKVLDDRRRARKHQAERVDLSAEDWATIQAAFGYQCVYCPYYNPECSFCPTRAHELTKDHITPYALRGAHTRWNVVPACASCNAKKGKGPPPGPVQPLLL